MTRRRRGRYSGRYGRLSDPDWARALPPGRTLPPRTFLHPNRSGMLRGRRGRCRGSRPDRMDRHQAIAGCRWKANCTRAALGHKGEPNAKDAGMSYVRAGRADALRTHCGHIPGCKPRGSDPDQDLHSDIFAGRGATILSHNQPALLPLGFRCSRRRQRPPSPSGNWLSFPLTDIESRVIPQMRGFEYLGPNYCADRRSCAPLIANTNPKIARPARPNQVSA